MLKNYLLLAILSGLIFAGGCAKKENPDTNPTPKPSETPFYKSVDLSFQKELEDWPTTFYNSQGNPIDVLGFFAENGVNIVRLKLWHTPQSQYNSLNSVIEFAKRIQQNNMDIWLDIHYSDTWADPAHQTMPVAWQGLSTEVLNDSVYKYTRNVIQSFKDNGLVPAIVQIGNETNTGFLWNTGRVGGSYDNNWPVYASLAGQATKAIRDVDATGSVRIMFHYAGHQGANWYFGKLAENGVDYDIIGISYYAIWHGKSLDDLQNNLKTLGNTYTKHIMIAETAYPWSLGWNDWTNNIWGLEDQLISDYPATPDGQKKYLQRINEVLHNLGNYGMGYCYWAPDFVAFKGPEATNGSNWENAALFDFDNKALPAVEAFSE